MWEELKKYIESMDGWVDDWYTSLRLSDILDKMEELEKERN